VTASSLLELKAQLYRTQEQSRLVKEGAIPKRDSKGLRKTGIDAGSIYKQRNAGVEARDEKDRLEVKVGERRLREVGEARLIKHELPWTLSVVGDDSALLAGCCLCLETSLRQTLIDGSCLSRARGRGYLGCHAERADLLAPSLRPQSTSDRMAECRAALERKSALYEKLMRGEVEDEDDAYNVDFVSKGLLEDEEEDAPTPAAPGPIDTAAKAVGGTGIGWQHATSAPLMRCFT
jgi:hypothetical protein